jgi:uncharacterized protein YacL
MNHRKIWFSGLVTAAVGVGIGLVLAKIVSSPFNSRPYRHLARTYMAVCGTGGLLVGASQEALRQLQEKRDREEKDSENLTPPSSHHES